MKKVKIKKQDTNFTYKNPDLLRKFVTDQGYIVSREKSGLSWKMQKLMGREVKRARHLGLLPFTQTL